MAASRQWILTSSHDDHPSSSSKLLPHRSQLGKRPSSISEHDQGCFTKQSGSQSHDLLPGSHDQPGSLSRSLLTVPCKEKTPNTSGDCKVANVGRGACLEAEAAVPRPSDKAGLVVRPYVRRRKTNNPN